ncbi:MAG: hypothetical protein LBC83_05075 [Oscillospiraceae bacterium]|jgi:hypothetical protein|nr:hypothetical protein [Oscillospiraceae bacterium]
MTQFYVALVIDKHNTIKMIEPWMLGGGLNLMEHSWIGDGSVNAVCSLIYNNPCKVAWIGDYSDRSYDPAKDAYAKTLSCEEFEKVFETAWCGSSFIKPYKLDQEGSKLTTSEIKTGYLINHDLKCYVDMAAYIKRSTVPDDSIGGCCIHPLPLLTACGNGRGDGDFYGRKGRKDVGTWAFHRIMHANEIPSGYNEKDCCFIDARVPRD